MMIQYRRGVISLSLTALFATHVWAAPIIGVAYTRGTMEVDNTSIRGTANVTDGSSVRTNDTASQVQFQSGVQATLDARTSASVFVNRIELKQGAGQLTMKQGFDLDALGFRVSAAGPKAVARVAYERADRILVTAVNSNVKVSRNGVFLASLSPGTTYFFEPDGEDEQQAVKTAGKSSGKTTSTNRGAGVKSGVSAGAKWGIAVGIAAGTGVGLGVGLLGDDASR